MENLPLFPIFRPFNIDDIYWYRDFYFEARLNPYVDVHHENLLVWLNFNNDLQISKIDDNTIAFRYTNPLDNDKLNILPLSKNLKDDAIEKIFNYQSENNLEQSVQEIPINICENLDLERWNIENYRDGAEYILDTKQQVDLAGSDFSRQRRRIGYFEREHLHDEIQVEYHKEFTDEIIAAFDHHIESMKTNSNDESAKNNTHEISVIKRNLELANIFHKKAIIVTKNKEVIALAMISFLDNQTAAINHLKVDYSIQYIFQYTLYRIAQTLSEYEIKEMNLEQDLGLEGLRIFKERMQPSRMLEKVIIRPKQ